MLIIKKRSWLLLFTLAISVSYFALRKGQTYHHLEINSRKAPCGMYSSPYALKKDSSEVMRILNLENCNISPDLRIIRRNVFAKASVELLYTNKSRTEFSVRNYVGCQAELIDSVLTIRFLEHGPYARGFSMEGESIEIKYQQQDFQTVIEHYNSCIGGYRGKRVNMRAEWLLLNKATFAVGDTLCGRMKMIGKRDKSYFTMKGNFKAIVEKGVKPFRLRERKN